MALSYCRPFTGWLFAPVQALVGSNSVQQRSQHLHRRTAEGRRPPDGVRYSRPRRRPHPHRRAARRQQIRLEAKGGAAQRRLFCRRGAARVCGEETGAVVEIKWKSGWGALVTKPPKTPDVRRMADSGCLTYSDFKALPTPGVLRTTGVVHFPTPSQVVLGRAEVVCHGEPGHLLRSRASQSLFFPKCNFGGRR